METDIESGVRWGELTELRVKDIDFTTRIVTISRAVVELPANVRTDGKRFVVKDYPKDRKPRRFKLSSQIVKKLKAHCDAENLGPDDLIFAIRHQEPEKATTPWVIPNPDVLGLTPPNEKGRQYKHGTLTGYGEGKCRCEHCKAACAIYRAQRRAQGKDRPPRGAIRTVTTDGHIPNNWFRNHVWNEAVKAANLGFHVRPHDLRHAHALRLLAGGADLQVVKERLGHASISTTERYLHTLPDADETALDALSSIRSRSKKRATRSEHELASGEIG